MTSIEEYYPIKDAQFTVASVARQLDALSRRHDGLIPADELLAALAGEPVDVLRRRAISREIDRLALTLARSIAGRRQRLLPPRGDCERERLAMAELSRRLAFHRDLGTSLALTTSPERVLPAGRKSRSLDPLPCRRR